MPIDSVTGTSTVDLAPVPTDAPGVYLRPPAFEGVLTAVRGALEAAASKTPMPSFSTPPVIARRTVERAGYADAFPHLLGIVHAYAGGRDLGPQRYTGHGLSDLVLLPAACYHIYPLLAGRKLTGPARYLVHGTCFRQERTAELGRLRSFLMSELVYAGAAEACTAWRSRWLERVAAWLRRLELDVAVELATDPFFGPGDRLLRATQREQELKWELTAPVGDGTRQAVASCNYHKDHFGAAYGIAVDDTVAHTACVAFGLDRVALALVHRHGPDVDTWPTSVRAALGCVGEPE
jgi:seryl-tRNA synthetase